MKIKFYIHMGLLVCAEENLDSDTRKLLKILATGD